MTACTVQNGAIFYGRAEGGDFHRLPSRGDLPGIYIHVLCCFALFVCLFDLACFFLSSFSSLI